MELHDVENLPGYWRFSKRTIQLPDVSPVLKQLKKAFDNSPNPTRACERPTLRGWRLRRTGGRARARPISCAATRVRCHQDIRQTQDTRKGRCEERLGLDPTPELDEAMERQTSKSEVPTSRVGGRGTPSRCAAGELVGEYCTQCKMQVVAAQRSMPSRPCPDHA